MIKTDPSIPCMVCGNRDGLGYVDNHAQLCQECYARAILWAARQSLLKNATIIHNHSLQAFHRICSCGDVPRCLCRDESSWF